MKRSAVVALVAAAMFVGSGIAGAEHLQEDLTVVLDPPSAAAGDTVTATLRVTCVDGASIEFEIEPAGDVDAAICDIDTYAARLTAPSRPNLQGPR